MNRRRFLEVLGLAVPAAVIPRKTYFFLDGLWRTKATDLSEWGVEVVAGPAFLSELEAISSTIWYEREVLRVLENEVAVNDWLRRHSDEVCKVGSTVRIRTPRRFASREGGSGSPSLLRE